MNSGHRRRYRCRAVPSGVLTPELKERWDVDGWCVVREAIPAATLAPAQEAVRLLFPTPAEMVERRGPDAAKWHTWDAPWPEFPFHSSRLNALVLHDRVVDLAEGLLGTDDLALYMGIVTAKYAHQSSGYNQLLHADYPNHMLVVPRHEPRFQQVEFFVYLTDVTTEAGATRFVSWQKTKDLPVEQHTLNYVDFADLYEDLSDASAPAGSVVAYRPDVYHRSVDHTDPNALADHVARVVPSPRRRLGRLPGLARPRLLLRAEQVRPAGDAAPARAARRARARTSVLERVDPGGSAGPVPRARHGTLAEGHGALRGRDER